MNTLEQRWRLELIIYLPEFILDTLEQRYSEMEITDEVSNLSPGVYLGYSGAETNRDGDYR